MARFVTLLFVLLEVAVLIRAQWTTMTSIPYFNYGGAVAFGDTVFAAVVNVAYTFDTTTGVWVGVPACPANSLYAALGALSDERAVVAGGNPVVQDVHIFKMQTVTWTTVASLPQGTHVAAAGCDGQRFWVAAGFASVPISVLQEYDSVADAWTLRAPLPVAASPISGTYCDGTLAVNRDYWIYLYSVALDTWTTGTNLPTYSGSLYGAFSSIAGFGFVVGSSNPPTYFHRLERYDFHNDVWTILDPAPLESSRSVTAITASGLLVAIGNYAGQKHVQGFTTGFSASPAGVSGDPLFHTFTGPPVHLSLGTSVFNFLTTPTVVVNALVEEFPSFPPEQNTFVTAIGIVSEVNGCLFLIYCSVIDENHLCSWNTRCQERPVEWRNVLTSLGHGIRLSVGGLSLEVHLASSTLEYMSNESVKEVNSTFINVWVHPPPPILVRPGVFGGIIGDLCSLGLPRVLDHLVVDAYTVADGCIFATEVEATEGMFLQHGSAPIGE